MVAIFFKQEFEIMNNSDIYTKAFIEAFEVEESEVPDLAYESVEVWDSVGHMVLMSILEDSFEIVFEMEDIIDFSDFVKGKELLEKYGVSF